MPEYVNNLASTDKNKHGFIAVYELVQIIQKEIYPIYIVLWLKRL